MPEAPLPGQRPPAPQSSNDDQFQPSCGCRAGGTGYASVNPGDEMIEPTLVERLEQRRDRSPELLTLYGIKDDDLARIARYGAIVSRHVDVYVDKFYTWLAQQPE